MPPAPARFSTITGCPSAAVSLGASMRVIRSGGPPGGEGTMMWISLFGYRASVALRRTGPRTRAAALP